MNPNNISGQQDYATVLSGVAEQTRTHYDIRRNIVSSLENHVADMVCLHADVSGLIFETLENHLSELCNLEQFIHAEIEHVINDHTDRQKTLHANLQWMIDEHVQKMQNKAKEKAKRKARRENQVPQESCSPSGDSQLYPALPSQHEYASRLLRSEKHGEFIDIGSFPTSMFDMNNESGVWWSLVPTPNTRAIIAYFESDADNAPTKGDVYFNLAMDMPVEELSKVIAGIGIDPNTFVVIDPQTAYDQACNTWGQVAVDCIYDSLGMETYRARPNDQPALPRHAPEKDPQQEAIQNEEFVALPEEQRARNAPQGLNQAQIEDMLRRVMRGEVVPELQQRLQNIVPAMPALPAIPQMPTMEQFCAWMNQLSVAFGMPRDLIPPCLDLQAIARRLIGNNV